MKLGKILAGFGVAILASVPVAAQHAGGAGHAGGANHPGGTGRAGIPGGRAGIPTGVPRTLPGSRSIPPIAPVTPFRPLGAIPMSQRTRPFAPPFLPPPNPGYQAPAGPFAAGFRRPGFGLGFYTQRLYNNFPFFYYYSFGAPACGPFFQATPGWPAYNFPGAFSCYNGSFFSFGYMPPYSSSFPPGAYGGVLGSAIPGQQILPPPGTMDAGTLDYIAGIAARESAQSNPRQQATQLYLKDGIMFGVIDYWVERGKLSYVTTFGIAHTVDLDDLDLPKTVKINSARGIDFVLRERTPAAPPQ